MIEVDRSRIIAAQTCPRSRWLAYHACGKGLQRKAKALPLCVGSAFHAGAEELLKGDIETACYRAIKFLHDAFSQKGVGMDGEEVTDSSLAYSAQEQVALTEGLIRGWGLERLDEFLSTFEVIEVEKEGRAILNRGRSHRETLNPDNDDSGTIEVIDSDDLVLMFRPDALVRERLSGDIYIISWKTSSTYSKRTLNQCRTDHQSISEVWGRSNDTLAMGEGRGAPTHIEGVVYLFCVKGRRSLDDWTNQWIQNSHLIYGWKKVKPSDEFDDQWSWLYKWPKEDGQGNSTLGKGWKKVPIWSDYLGGVKQWITDLHNRQVFPRHLDPFDGIFPQSLPVERRRDEVQRWRNQVVAQEMKIAESIVIVEAGATREDHQDMLDTYFPQYSHSCHSYSGCQFLGICWNSVPAEPGELYQLRVSNHPEQEDEDGQ